MISTAFYLTANASIASCLVNVLNYRQLTTIGTVVSACFLAVLAVALMSNPQIGG
ncbi:MAG: hypothetical protein FWD59_09045 [Micrococcales bacterium]|nr:hypothetical protein [Micrococcales bacterium]